MNTAIINFKTDPALKKRTQKRARALGLNLSVVLNSLLRRFSVDNEFYLGLRPEDPSEYLIQALKESEEDRKAGRVSPAFDNVEDAIAWLNDKNRKYQNENRVQQKI